MRRLLLSLACLALAMAFSVPSAAAQAPTRDSVTGTAEIMPIPSFSVRFTFDASSGPTGEDPAGNVAIDVFGPVNPVTCLKVEGNRAIVGVELTEVEPPGTGALIYVTDAGDVGFIPPPDSIGVVITESIPEVCAEQPLTETLISGGDITVVDAQAPFPTTKDQCEKGGWRDFGFKNQGQCIKSVQNAASG